MSNIKRPSTLLRASPPVAKVRATASVTTALAVALYSSASAQTPPPVSEPAPVPAPPAAQVQTPPPQIPPAPQAVPGQPNVIPPVTVVQPKQAPARPRPVQAAPAAPVEAAAAPEPQPAPGGLSVAIPGPVVPGANPYADPLAPYKIDVSANARLTEPLLDTPRSISVVPKEVLADKGATSLRDLARTTPGVTLGTGEGGNPFGDRLFIRGFDARNDAYINGIRDSGVPIRESFNTEQVEVLKGPSATIGGRGTTGGAVNVITKQAQDKNFAVGTTTVGTDKTTRGTLDTNYALSPEFSLRVNGMWQNAGVAGRDEVYDDRWGGAIALAWKPSSSTKITADYYHLQLNQLPDWGVPWDSVRRQPFTESGVDRNNYYGWAKRDFQDSKQDVATVVIDHKLAPDLLLSSRFRYGVSVIDYIASAPEAVVRTNPNPDLWTVQSRPKSRWQENETIANQTDLTAKFETFGIRHTLVSGFEISNEKVTRDAYTGLTSEAFNPGPGVPAGTLVVNLWNPDNSIPFVGSPTRANAPNIVQVATKALYALDTIKLADHLIFTAGMRLDHYDISLNQFNNAGVLTQALARDDLLFNYNLGLTYKPAPNGSYYIAYATSSNPVGQELDGSGQAYGGLAIGNALLDPEMNTAIEVGTKWELFERHLLFSAALFQTDKDNAREASGAFVVSTGKYRVRGIDISAVGRISPALSIYAGYVALDSEVLDSIVAADRGKKLANIAHQSFNILAKYKLNSWLSVGGQATARSQIFGGTMAANTNMIEGYWRFDAMSEIKFNEHWELQLQALNLTNEVIYDALYRSGTPFVYEAPGRAAYATLKVKY